MAVARAYSNGDADLGRFSSKDDGMISMLVSPMVARSCFRRGDAEARIVRRRRRRVRAGRSRGGGRNALGLGGGEEAGFSGVAS